MHWWAVRHRVRVFVHRIRFPGQALFNDAAVADLVGKTVLVGITRVDRSGNLLGHEDYRGRIIRANSEEGVVIQTPSGMLQRLPPDLRAFFVARRGGYRSRTSGEVINDPDLMTRWTHTPSS